MFKGKKEDEKIDLGDIDPNMVEEEEEAPPFGGDEETESPFESEDSENAPFFDKGEEAPFIEETQAVVPTEFDEKISTLEEKVNQMDSALANVRRMHEELEEKLNKLEKSLEEMLSIYELVTNEINPFVEHENDAVETEREEPKEEGHPPPLQSYPEQKVEFLPETPKPKVSDKASKKELKSVPDLEIRLEKLKEDPFSIMILFKWIEFMLKRVGFRGMVNLLIYYESIGWISEEVRSKILKYAREIDFGEKPKRRKMSAKDHLISLYFIAKLKGIKIETTVYSPVAVELERMGIL